VLKRLGSLIGGYLVGWVAIVLITLFYQYIPDFEITTCILTYLLAILIASAMWGLGVSVFMSVAAGVTLDYFFFPPVHHFDISNPQDWVSLFAFLITSVIGSELSARARRQADEANRRKNEVEQLYKFSRVLLNARDPIELRNEIPRQIVNTFKTGSRSPVPFRIQQETYRSGIAVPRLDAIRLEAAAAREDVGSRSFARGFLCSSAPRIARDRELRNLWDRLFRTRHSKRLGH
jgi:K+-sensing histidine kinase KdpD